MLNAAARETLRPLGLAQKGRSRTWLDDRGWWLGIVEFDHSRFEKGTFLDVGANLLWVPNERSTPAGWRMIGGRVDLPGGKDFVEYRSDKQFEPLAPKIVKRAAKAAEAQRERLATPTKAAGWLDAQKDLSHDAHVGAGIVLALAGRTAKARRHLGPALERRSEDEGDRAAAKQLRRLLELVDDREALRKHVRKTIRANRKRLGLGAEDVDL